MKYAKVDVNQPEIVKALRKEGAIVKHVYQLKNLFDIIVYYKGKTFSVEIKNGYKSKLTKGEIECKKDIESVGVKYWVIYTVEDALKMIKSIN